MECVQEDRYRQTLKPRGYTDLLEAQIDKCAALLNKFIPGFKLEYLDYHLSNYGVVLQQPEGQPGQFIPSAYLGAGVVEPDHLQGVVNEYDPAASAHYPPGPAYPPRADAFTVDASTNIDAEQAVMLNPTPGPSGAQFVSRGLYDTQQQQGAGGSRLQTKSTAKGGDPMANDVSSTTGLVKAFGVSQKIAKDLKPGEQEESSSEHRNLDRCFVDAASPEDMIGGVPVVRDSAVSKPRDPAAWTETAIPRNSAQQQQQFLLPREREIVNQVLATYFTDLNPYRPIFDEADVREKLDVLYSSVSSDADVRASVATGKHHDVTEDSGSLCCVYLIFALGTLCVQNRRIHQAERVEENWPSHEEFYDLALALKPDLQNSISTLQALLILHWYLFTEVRKYLQLNEVSANFRPSAASWQGSLASGRQHGPSSYRTWSPS